MWHDVACCSMSKPKWPKSSVLNQHIVHMNSSGDTSTLQHYLILTWVIFCVFTSSTQMNFAVPDSDYKGSADLR